MCVVPIALQHAISSWRRCCTLHGTAHLSRSATQVVAGEGFGFTIQYEAKNLCYMFFAGTGRRVAILLFKSCVV